MSSNNFLQCLHYVLLEEGGLADLRGDRGGLTNHGVTQATYDAYRISKGWLAKSVRMISPGEVSDIYRTGFWNKIGCDALPAGVDLSAFDYAVNSGPGSILGVLGRFKGQSPVATINGVSAVRLGFLHRLLNWSRFGKDWGGRVGRIKTVSLKMVQENVA